MPSVPEETTSSIRLASSAKSLAVSITNTSAPSASKLFLIKPAIWLVVTEVRYGVITEIFLPARAVLSAVFVSALPEAASSEAFSVVEAASVCAAVSAFGAVVSSASVEQPVSRMPVSAAATARVKKLRIFFIVFSS